MLWVRFSRRLFDLCSGLGSLGGCLPFALGKVICRSLILNQSNPTDPVETAKLRHRLRKGGGKRRHSRTKNELFLWEKLLQKTPVNFVDFHSCLVVYLVIKVKKK